MKKIASLFLTFLVLISFSFYSCASKPENEENSTISQLPDISENDESENKIDGIVEFQENSDEKNDENNDGIATSEKNDGEFADTSAADDAFSNETNDEMNGDETLDLEDDTTAKGFELPQDFEEPDVFEDEKTDEQFDGVNDVDENDSENQENSDEAEELVTPDELDVISPFDENAEDNLSGEENDIDFFETVDSDNDDSGINGFTDNQNSYDEITTENDENSNNIEEKKSENESPDVESENKSHESEHSADNENESKTEPDESFADEENQEEKIEIRPSRKVTVKRGEYLDVVYPGNGWIYMGATDGSKNVTYNGRKLGTENTTFTLIGKTQGTVILHFYKTDNLTGNYIDDYLEIEVLKDRTTSKVHQIAPSYAEIVPEKNFENLNADNTKDGKSTSEKSFGNKNQQNDESKNSEMERTENEFSESNRNSPWDDNGDGFYEQNFDAESNGLVPESTDSKESAGSKESTVSKKSESDTKLTETKKSFDENDFSNYSDGSNEDDDIIFLDSDNDDEEIFFIDEKSDKKTENKSVSSSTDPEEILQSAYEAFNEKNYENALKMIEDYINLSAKKLDEAYFLKGQIYEAQSGIQNINNAVEEYQKIKNLYPSSKYWDKANKRIIYLKRFYLEVR